MEFNDDLKVFKSIADQNRGVLFYFSTISCVVGEAVEPKVRLLLEEKFPDLLFFNVDMNLNPKITTENQVFVEPTIVLFFGGKEYVRKSRNFSLLDLEDSISRLYKLAFE